MTDDTKDRRPATQDALQAARSIENDAGSASGTVKRDAKVAAEEIKHDVEGVVEAAREQAAEVGQEAEQMLDRGRETLGESLGGLAGAMRTAADQIDEQKGQGAQLTRELAGRVDQVASTIKSHDVGDLVGIAEDFGRRQPAAFLGAAALMGFAASRFAVASSHRKGRQPGGRNQTGEVA